MKKINSVLTLILLLCSFLQAQSFSKTSYSLKSDKNFFEDGLYGNGIVDMAVKDSVLWAATGYGLNKAVYNSSANTWEWKSFRTEQYGGKGGVTALGFMDDSTLWIATAFDTTVREDTDEAVDLPAGSGLSFTRDGGQSWTHVPQPVDPREIIDYSPTTTVVQNLIYDIAFVDSTIWIASFGGGLRRSDDMGNNWQVVTTDSLFFSSGVNLNHRAFSLLNANDTLWAGTADGISKSPDNGLSWKRFVFSNSNEQTISGNFVTALGWQESSNTIWAATMEAEDANHKRGLSRSSDGGKAWERLLLDEQIFSYNFTFDGNSIFAAADKGLHYSTDNGENWNVITALKDYNSGNEIFHEDYYSAAVQPLASLNRLWLGSADGLATTLLDGDLTSREWQIFRSYVSIKRRTKPAVYAYPSPFSPSRHLYIRFVYDEDKKLNGPIKIYDFAMDEVASISSDDLKPKWDGKNSNGDPAASGVYFFRAKVSGKVTWGKIVIIN
jgi:hypothetical protein